MPIRLVYLMGVEANRYILAEHPENFAWREAFSLLEVANGPTALVLSDGDEHRRRRRLVQPGFAIKRVEAHLELITREIDATLAGWTAGRSLDAMTGLRATVRRIVVRALFGDHLGGDADRIGELLEPALQYVGRTPLSRIDVNLPFLPYGKAVRARDAVDTVVMGEIDRRRRAGVDPTASSDVLSALLAESEPGEDGDEALSQSEICDQIRSLIAAGYDTTSSAAAWLVHGLGANPAAFERLRNQVRDTTGDAAPTLDDLRAMPLVNGVVRESCGCGHPLPSAAAAPFRTSTCTATGSRAVPWSCTAPTSPIGWPRRGRTRLSSAPNAGRLGSPCRSASCPSGAATANASASRSPPSSSRCSPSAWRKAPRIGSTTRTFARQASPTSPPRAGCQSP